MTRTRADRLEGRRRRSRFDEHRSERRDQLLDAATEVVRRLGPATTMEAIAAEVGVAKPVLYRYFGDRSGLFDALAARFGSTLVATLTTALALELPPREQVTAAIDAYVGVLEDDPHVYRFATTRLRSDSGAPGGVLDHAISMLARGLSDALHAGGRDAGPAEVWAAGIVGMVHVATDRWVAHPVLSKAVLVEHLANLVWSGLGSVLDATDAETRAVR